jgi:hypothetical protein
MRRLRPRSGLLLGAALLTFLSLPTAASSDVILVDDTVWGVQSVVRDTTNSQEFLRLDFTAGLIYDNVVAELGAGGTFEGWRVATLDDMTLLGSSAAIVHGSTDPVIIARAEQLRDWFCATCVDTSSTHVYARGLIADQITNPISGIGSVQLAFHMGLRLAQPNAIPPEPAEAEFRVGGYYYPDISDGSGVYLVRSVPEPTSLLLLLSGLSLFALRRRN